MLLQKISQMKHTVSLSPESNISIISSITSGTSISSSSMEHLEVLFELSNLLDAFVDTSPSVVVLLCQAYERQEELIMFQGNLTCIWQVMDNRL